MSTITPSSHAHRRNRTREGQPPRPAIAHTPTNPDRYHLGPWLEIVAGQIGRAPQVADLVDRHGLSRRTWHRYLRDGIDARTADRLAVATGWHPAYIWPHWH